MGSLSRAPSKEKTALFTQGRPPPDHPSRRTHILPIWLVYHTLKTKGGIVGRGMGPRPRGNHYCGRPFPILFFFGGLGRPTVRLMGERKKTALFSRAPPSPPPNPYLELGQVLNLLGGEVCVKVGRGLEDDG